MVKFDDWQKYFIVLLLLVFVFIVFQFINRSPFSVFVSDTNVDIKEDAFFSVFFDWLLVTGLGQQLLLTFVFCFLFVLFVVLIFWLFQRFNNNVESSDGLRIPVDTKTALNVFKYEFFIDSGVRVLRGIPVVGVVFKIFTTRTWANRTTGDRYLLIDFFVGEGSDRGCNVAIIRVDRGEDYIKNNVRERFIHGVSLSSANLQLKSFPLDTDSSSLSQLLQLREDARFDRDDYLVNLADTMIANTYTLSKNGSSHDSSDKDDDSSSPVIVPFDSSSSSKDDDSSSLSNEDKYRLNNRLS